MKFLVILSVVGQVGNVPSDVAPARDDSMAVQVSGSGSPVALIPGLLGSAYTYRHVVERLNGSGYRTIVIEPLGFGSSARPEGADYTLTAQADRVASVLREVVEEPVTMVAHSVGTSIAYRVAYRHPELVRAVISIEGGLDDSVVTPGMRTALRFSGLIRMMGRQAVVALLRRSMVGASASDAWITRDVIRAYTAGIAGDLAAGIRTLKAMADAEEPERLSEHLHQIPVPVRLLLGATPHNAAPPDEAIDRLRGSIADFAVVPVPDAGHFIQEEAFAAVVEVVEALNAGAGIPANR